MNIIDKNKYEEFRHILTGCRTILDAYYFGEKYNKHNSEMKQLVSSMSNGKRYEQVIDLNNMSSTLETLNNCLYREDAEEIINTKKTSDTTQMRTLMRISKNKPSRPINRVKLELPVEKKLFITKNCPHCDHPCKSGSDTEYIICGYNDARTGYDWKGCGRDWCFKCEKILCKSWDTNQLFVPMNRTHDTECCKQFSKENNRHYLEEFCQCHNENVCRVKTNANIF
jgi:hypothetical protein